ncbi:MAG TPA: MotA/TolQ/ExbB proton channel family protein [Verrucomicrobiae bacterium]|nr:MotA/TolQ/ExbB proton channel family protein [Verrucomicrobiae bacterium]
MLTIMTKGGPLMWFILIGAVLAVGVFLERLFHYHRAQIHTDDFVNGILNSLKRGNVTEAIETCKNTAGPVAQVVMAAVNNHDRSRDEIREAVQDTARTEVTRLERNLPILVTIAQVVPLFGFLGTVCGFIRVFQVIEKAQATTAGQLAGGTWQALLTTAGGLVVAIPSYIAYNYLVNRVQNLVLDMEKAANETVQYLARKEQGGEQSAKVVEMR